MSQSSDQFYLVKKEMLTESMLKTIEVKMLLEQGKAKTVNEAIKKVGISRSAYYKYRDSIFPFHTMVKEKMITLSILLEDRTGTLSELLQIIARSNGNVLTINQTIPLQGKANISLTIDTSPMKCDIHELIQQIRELDAVKKVDIIGSGS